MIGWNVFAAALAVAVSMGIAVGAFSGEPSASLPRRQMVAATDVVERDGVRGMLDATGWFVPIRPYSKIVSGSSVSDGLLLELCEPARILRFTNYSVVDSPFGYRFAGKGMPDPLGDLEALLALSPDLVLVHGFGRADRVARLREAGIVVFDLGEMRGLRTLLPNLRTLGTLLGRPDRGAELATRFERRMQGVSRGVPESERPTAIYVGVYGDEVFGGTDGTSYHDVLVAAGLRDAAAERYDNWPDYTPERLLLLDPEVIVTTSATEGVFCARQGMEQLRACQNRRVVGIDGALLGSPGLDMLEAAEALFEAVHGKGASGAP